MAATTPYITSINNWSPKSLADWQVQIPSDSLGSYRYGEEYDNTRLLAANDGSIVFVSDLRIGKYSSEGKQQWSDTLGSSESGDFLIDLTVGESIAVLIGSNNSITLRDYNLSGILNSADQARSRDSSLDELYGLSGTDIALLETTRDGEVNTVAASLSSKDGIDVWDATLLTQLRGDLLTEGLTATADSLYAFGRRRIPGSDPDQGLFVSSKSTRENSSWTASLGFTDDDLIFSVLPIGTNSSAYAIGATRGTGAGNTYGSEGILVSRISSTGETEWSLILQDRNTNISIEPTAAHASRDGSLYITTQAITGPSSYPSQITKISKNGSIEWSLVPYIIHTEHEDGSKSASFALLPLDSPVPQSVTFSQGGELLSWSHGRQASISEICEDAMGNLILAMITEDAKLYIAAFSDPLKIFGQSSDEIPPTLQSTTATSNQLILTFSEDIQIAGGGTLNPAYMTVTVDGQIRKITRSQITAPDHPSIHTASKLALTLSGRSLDRASSISISYNPPSNGTSSGFITDLTGNKLAAITSQAVDTYSSNTNISKSGIASAYKNLRNLWATAV